ncbi:WecB/TagA/CpsF family glycosyltransferase [Candidatus Gottesmanbacteria bacterium]|nr:WecB/TagA/CpsF family glycosyltransferase [Candidatus Poribacteria bacterium]MBM3283958.1 WecB/TagA/CpsF family glycosyltransferase [Candidatus Gottesmanbacteria bacterium]
MSLRSKNVLGINITVNKKTEILEEIGKYFEKVKSQKSKVKRKEIKPVAIFTPNPEIVNFARKNISFRKIVNSAQINIPDGWGIVWALKKLFHYSIHKISGADFMLDLVGLAAKKGLRIGLIGGRDGVAVKALECLKKKHANLLGWAMDVPEIELVGNVSSIKYQVSGIKNEKKIPNTKYLILNTDCKQSIATDQYFFCLTEEIIKRKIDILFVALGFPKQEYFINRIMNQEARIKDTRPLLLMAVGGTFDYLSGKIPRAPKWLTDRGLEWLYRLIRQPWRLSRQIKGAEFFWWVLAQS